MHSIFPSLDKASMTFLPVCGLISENIRSSSTKPVDVDVWNRTSMEGVGSIINHIERYTGGKVKEKGREERGEKRRRGRKNDYYPCKSDIIWHHGNDVSFVWLRTSVNYVIYCLVPFPNDADAEEPGRGSHLTELIALHELLLEACSFLISMFWVHEDDVVRPHRRRPWAALGLRICMAHQGLLLVQVQ